MVRLEPDLKSADQPVDFRAADFEEVVTSEDFQSFPLKANCRAAVYKPAVAERAEIQCRREDPRSRRVDVDSIGKVKSRVSVAVVFQPVKAKARAKLYGFTLSKPKDHVEVTRPKVVVTVVGEVFLKIVPLSINP